MGSVSNTFCIYHVVAPGQEPGAEDLPEGFAYPTMDELSEQVLIQVWAHLNKYFTHQVCLSIPSFVHPWVILLSLPGSQG